MTVPSEAENVASRFKILERPSISPGKCAVCGSVDRPVVDFGLNLQRYGAVMLCKDCVCEAADRVGMIRPEYLEAETLRTGQSVEEYLSAHNLKAIPNELYDSLAVALGNFSAVASDLLGNLPDDSDESDEGDSEAESGQLRLVFSGDESDDSKPVGDDETFDL